MHSSREGSYQSRIKFGLNLNIDCIVLCETFINDSNAQLMNIPGYKCIAQNRQTMAKGGVGIYI